MTTRDELIEAGASALVGGTNYHMTGDAGMAGTMNRLTATFVIDAVLPLITEAIAEAVSELPTWHRTSPTDDDFYGSVVVHAEAEIRAVAASIVREWKPDDVPAP